MPAAEGARRRRGVVENGCRGLAWVGGCSRTGGGGCTVHRPRVAFPAARAQRRDFVRFRRGEPWNPTAGAVRSGAVHPAAGDRFRCVPRRHHTTRRWLVWPPARAITRKTSERAGVVRSVGPACTCWWFVANQPRTGGGGGWCPGGRETKPVERTGALAHRWRFPIAAPGPARSRWKTEPGSAFDFSKTRGQRPRGAGSGWRWPGLVAGRSRVAPRSAPGCGDCFGNGGDSVGGGGHDFIRYRPARLSLSQ